MKHNLHPWLRKLIILLIAILALQAFPWGVQFLFSRKVCLHQPVEEITKIELRYSPHYEDKILYRLEKEEFDDFLKSLTSIRSYKVLAPQGYYGALYVHITYSDSSIDILGSYSCHYKPVSSKDNGWYFIPEEELYELFSRYVDLSKLPYISSYDR